MSSNYFDLMAEQFRPSNVSIVEFAESDEYCGKPLYPRQKVLLKLIWLEEMTGYEEDVLSEWISGEGEVEICPKVRERRQWLQDNEYKHFREIQLIGGRRSSKGHVTGISVARKMWDLIQIKDPAKYYGIDQNKQIYATMVAASEEQAKAFQYADAVGAVSSCKAMQRYIGKILEKFFTLKTPVDIGRIKSLEDQGFKVERDMSTLRVNAYAANASTLRGATSIMYVLDEMAHMMPGVSKSSAEEVYNAITPAIDQFGKDGMLFDNSSPYTEIGQFFEIYEMAKKLNNAGLPLDHRLLMVRFPSWELYKDWDRDKRFYSIGPIIESPDVSEEMATEEEKDPERFAVERRAEFAKIVDAFLNPFKVDGIFEPWPEGRELFTVTERKMGPETIYKGHADPAAVGANFGLAIGHTEPGEDRDGNIVNHVVFDYINAWIPGEEKDHTLNFLQIQDEIVDIVYKFRPKEFTMDQFESRHLIEYVQRESRARGANDVHVRLKTATRALNMSRALVFRTAINLGLVHAPADNRFSELARQELKFLQDKNGKIDHQTIGPVQTKDVADCMMEVVYYLIGKQIEEGLSNIQPAFGIGLGHGRDLGMAGRGSNPQMQAYYMEQQTRMRGKRYVNRSRQPKVMPGQRRFVG